MSQLDDHVKGIKGWLETQGYPLEMRVARSLNLLGLGFIQGWNYEDPDTSETREIDILSKSFAYGKNTLLIQAIIECKYSEHPIVGFTYGNNLSKSPIDFWVPCNILGRGVLNRIIKEERKNEIPIFSHQSTIAYALKQAYQNEEGKRKDKKDTAFEAIMSVVKASYALSKLYMEKVPTLPSLNGTETRPSVFIGIPTIVLRAPLFICYLDEHNNIAVEPRRGLLLEWSYPKIGTLMVRVIQENEVSNLGVAIIESTAIFSDKLNEFI
jgi:hypothetical protein